MRVLKSCLNCGKPIIEGMYCKKCAAEVEAEKKKVRINAGDVAFAAIVLGFGFLFWRKYQQFKTLPPGTFTQIKDDALLLPGVLIAKYYQAFFGKSVYMGAQMTYLLLAVLFYVAAFVALLLVKKKFDW